VLRIVSKTALRKEDKPYINIRFPRNLDNI